MAELQLTMPQALLGIAGSVLLALQASNGDALEDLVSRLASPSGDHAVTTQRVIAWWRLSDEEVVACRAHVRTLLGTCWSTIDTADAAWVDLQQPLWTPDYEPVAIVNMKEWDWSKELSEDLVYSDSRWRMLRQDAIGGQQVATHAVFDGSELTVWEYMDGVRQATRRRLPPAEGGSTVSFVEMSLWRARSRTHSLLRLAEASEWVSRSDRELGLEVDLTSPSRLRQVIPTPSNGYTCENPGLALLRYVIDEKGGSKLAVTFNDCRDSPVFGYALEWEPDGVFPRLLVATDYAAGTGLSTEESRLSIATRPATAEEVAGIAWQPSVGEQVIDERFGSVQTYQVSEFGRLPSDDTLAETSRAEIAELGVGVVSAYVSEELGTVRAQPTNHTTDKRSASSGPWLLAAVASLLMLGGGLAWRHLRASR